MSSRLSQASSRLTQSFEAKLKGLEPHAGPEDLELEARAGTEAIYTRLRSTPSEAQRLRPLQYGQSWANLNAYAGGSLDNLLIVAMHMHCPAVGTARPKPGAAISLCR